MKIGIGIDTGGTYTDAVIYDFESKKIMGSAKSLTTKEDLSIGILSAMDKLPQSFLQQAELIALSTTLATNACVEDKGGRAKLLFFGGDSKIIDQLGGKYGLPPSDEIYLQESYTTFSGECKREPDWDLFFHNLEHGFDQLDGVGIIEMNAMRNGAVVEKKAKELFQQRYDIPVVCGHELFSELNCLQRGASTLLNAGLFPVIQEFLTAVKKALARRNIHAMLVIVRSDGSLMSEQFASVRPVETLLCGPAASAMGGAKLSGCDNSLIVDMGGTTTDIAIVKDGKPVTVVDGVSIGRWKTYVDGLYVKTFGLGGDSAVHYEGKRLVLEEYRVVPLCVAAQKFPSMLEDLRELAEHKRKHTHFLYEHYLLVKDIENSPRYTEEEKAFCRALKEKPLSISKAAGAVGKDIYTLDVKRLLKDGVVQLCGLTPTDIMHIKKDFAQYCTEASLRGAEFAAYNLECSIDDFCDLVYGQVKRKIYQNLVEAMLENKYPHYRKDGFGKEMERLIDEGYQAAKTGNRDPLLSMMFHTDFALVGLGAPIRIFLEEVAQMLGAKAVFPEHYQVANALGAIIGNVSASCSVEIRPNTNSEGIASYTVFASRDKKTFEDFEAAKAFAVEEAEKGAREEALKRGAKGELTVSCSARENTGEASECTIYFGTTVLARAVGTVGF